MARKITYLGAKTPEGSGIKFSMPNEVHDIVTHAIFFPNRSKGFTRGEGSNLAFFH